MRKCIVLFSILICTISYVSCQNSGDKDVPAEVQSNFEKKYPGENDPDWEKDKNGNFESTFKIDGKHYRADFKPDGSWVETESSIDKKDLPEAIMKVLKSKFDDFDIVEIEEVQHHSKGFFYDVEIKKDGEKQDVEFSKTGAIIN